MLHAMRYEGVVLRKVGRDWDFGFKLVIYASGGVECCVLTKRKLARDAR